MTIAELNSIIKKIIDTLVEKYHPVKNFMKKSQKNLTNKGKSSSCRGREIIHQ